MRDFCMENRVHHDTGVLWKRPVLSREGWANAEHGWGAECLAAHAGLLGALPSQCLQEWISKLLEQVTGWARCLPTKPCQALRVLTKADLYISSFWEEGPSHKLSVTVRFKMRPILRQGDLLFGVQHSGLSRPNCRTAGCAVDVFLPAVSLWSDWVGYSVTCVFRKPRGLILPFLEAVR